MRRVAVIFKQGFKGKKGVMATLAAHGLVRSKQPEFVLAVGGDGTLLRAVQKWPTKPILAVNAGALGFLCQGSLPELGALLRELKQGRLRVEERAMLSYSINGKRVGRALNDVLVCSEGHSRALRVQLLVGRQKLACLMCDGVIVASPTGTTGYNLSAGGSIIEPGVDAISVCPINTHLSRARPMVVGGTTPINLKFDRPGAKISLVADGFKTRRIGPKSTVTIRKSKTKAKLLARKKDTYFKKLAQLLCPAQEASPLG